MTEWRIENIATMAVAMTGVCVLYYLSNSWHSLWAFLLLLNLSSVSKK